MANIKDVAQRAGVSVSTASRALRGEGYTSAEVRAKVGRAAQELDYVPNVLAQSMRGQLTRTIGFLVYDIVNPFFANLAAGVEDAAHEQGFNVVICSSHPWKSSEREKSYMQMLLQRQIDGLVLQHVFSSEQYAALLERQGHPGSKGAQPPGRLPLRPGALRHETGNPRPHSTSDWAWPSPHCRVGTSQCRPFRAATA